MPISTRQTEDGLLIVRDGRPKTDDEHALNKDERKIRRMKNNQKAKARQNFRKRRKHGR